MDISDFGEKFKYSGNSGMLDIVKALEWVHKNIEAFGEFLPLERWYEVAENANWKNFADMKDDFGSVDSVGNQHYVFNLSGNSFRLVVVVKFVMGYVFVRWVGRHKDYDKIDCKNI